MTIRYVNLTKHTVRLVDGTEFNPVGKVARIIRTNHGFDDDGVCLRQGEYVAGLPAPKKGVRYIVSSWVALYLRRERSDLVSPDTASRGAVYKGHHLWAVPGFVRWADER